MLCCPAFAICWQISEHSRFRLGWLLSPLNAPTILAALELREFSPSARTLPNLKNSKPAPEIFLAACAGLRAAAGMYRH